MDLHAHQIQGFFDIPVDHLFAAPVIDQYFQSLMLNLDDCVVVSPDEGSIKRVLKHVGRLGGKLAIVDKRRLGGITKQANLIGAPIEGRIALLFDDMISTGSSICGAAQMVREAGAREIHLAATHGLFCGPATERLANAPVKQIVITDTIPLTPERRLPTMKVLSVAPLLGEAVKRIHRNESVSTLFP
jgi:ribose-phosphate pyrophosphokinase